MILLDRATLRAMAQTAAWLTGRRRRIRVVGDSMIPTVEADEFVLVDAGRRPTVGDLAVARHPDRDDLLVVKRVASITADGRFELLSDNPTVGTDSRVWGPLEAAAIEGTVTLIMDRPKAVLRGPTDGAGPGPSGGPAA